MHHQTTNPMSGTFLRELDRLIATSGFSVEAVAELSELPVAALTGAYGGAIRVPALKVRKLAEITGADYVALLRIWCADYAPWLLQLLDDLCPCARANAERGAVAWASASLRWRCGASIDPFSWAMPAVLRVGRMS